MAIYKGECKTCGLEDIAVFDSDDQCLTCRRLDDIEKRLDGWVPEDNVPSKLECPYKTECNSCGYYKDYECELEYTRFK